MTALQKTLKHIWTRDSSILLGAPSNSLYRTDVAAVKVWVDAQKCSTYGSKNSSSTILKQLYYTWVADSTAACFALIPHQMFYGSMWTIPKSSNYESACSRNAPVIT